MFNIFGSTEIVHSPYNGEIKVIKDLSGVRLVVGGVSQSGWAMKDVWGKGIGRINRFIKTPEKILVLGLGGGSIAEVIQKKWKTSKIKGIDIDPVIVELGKKHLCLSKIEHIDIEIADAHTWVERRIKQQLESKTKRQEVDDDLFDIIFIDLFKGEETPANFRTKRFFSMLTKLLNPYGIVVVNHLYGVQDKKNAANLLKVLRQVFGKVVSYYPLVNVIFICFPNNINIDKSDSLR